MLNLYNSDFKGRGLVWWVGLFCALKVGLECLDLSATSLVLLTNTTVHSQTGWGG